MNPQDKQRFDDERLIFDNQLEKEDFYLICDDKTLERMTRKYNIDTQGKSRVRIAVELNNATLNQIWKEIK